MTYMTNKDKIILEMIKKYRTPEGGRVLDVGAGDKPLENKLPNQMVYVSLDHNTERKPDIVADISKKLPIKDGKYDFVVATEVLEHTLYPEKIVEELKRICKKSGFVIISMPNEYNFYLRLKFLLGIQNNTEVPFREDLWRNHIHKARVKDLINFYKKNFDVVEIRYSWDSFSDRKFLQFVDKFIYNLFMPFSKCLFSRSAIMISKNG